MPPISVMVKPSSSNCNMNCGYCFYHSLAGQRESFSHGFMNINIIEDIIIKAFEFTKGERVYLSFQGGEPLLSRKEFYKAVNKAVKERNIYNSEVHIALQTNGTLIDGEWCKIFKENNYLIGVSLDGRREDNIYRVYKDGKETFDDVIRGINLLQKNNIDYNILSVVTRLAAENIIEIYEFCKGGGHRFLQFIPCLRPFGHSEEDDMYMTGEQYGDYLVKLFKLYYQDYIKGNYISVRQLDNFVSLAAGRQAEQCGMNGHCSCQFVIEGDGSVYPCDFYCLDEYQLGNIVNTDFFTLSKSMKLREFVRNSMKIEDKCRNCGYYQLCRNGCFRERECVDKCTAYGIFFNTCLPYLQKLKAGLKRA